jgi:porin
MEMNVKATWTGLAAAAVMTPLAAVAQAAPPPQQPYSIWTTPTLLRFPGSPFDALRQNGVDVGGTVTSFYQGQPIGSGNRLWRFGAKGDLKVVLDSEKMGLWPGTVVVVNQEWVWGQDALKTGAGLLLPVNVAMGFPRLGGGDQNTSINVTQKFGDMFSVSFGKFNMLDLASGVPILGGGGLDTFTHLGLGAPASGVTPPYLYGGMATLKTPYVILTGMLYDPRNAQDTEVIRKPFTDGRTFSLSATVPTKFFDLPGFYGARVAFSNARGLDLSRIPELTLPGATQAALQKKGYRFLSFSAQQYLWLNPDGQGQGVGVFGEVAVSDGNPNPLKWHVIGGISGTGAFGRPLDRWGVGYFRYALSKDAKDSLAQIGVRRRDEWGMEAYYNLAVTPWLRVTGTVTYIRPTEPDKKNAVFAGIRTQVRF